MKLKVRTAIRDAAIVLLSILNGIYLYTECWNISIVGFESGHQTSYLLYLVIPLAAFILLAINVLLWLKEKVNIKVINE